MPVNEVRKIAADEDQMDAGVWSGPGLEIRERRPVRLANHERNGGRAPGTDRDSRLEIRERVDVGRLDRGQAIRRTSAAGERRHDEQEGQKNTDADGHVIPFGKRKKRCGGT